ncbi:beta-lactamase-like protein [Schizophyllum commune]
MGYNNMAITFLGTSSGGGPTEHRNCSSLLVDCCGNGDLWMVDCAEGTTRQFMFTRDVRPMQVKKIFITHMHVDHVMGIIGFLRNVLFPLPVLGSGPDRDPNAPVSHHPPPFDHPTYLPSSPKCTSTAPPASATSSAPSST